MGETTGRPLQTGSNFLHPYPNQVGAGSGGGRGGMLQRCEAWGSWGSWGLSPTQEKPCRSPPAEEQGYLHLAEGSSSLFPSNSRVGAAPHGQELNVRI